MHDGVLRTHCNIIHYLIHLLLALTSRSKQRIRSEKPQAASHPTLTMSSEKDFNRGLVLLYILTGKMESFTRGEK